MKIIVNLLFSLIVTCPCMSRWGSSKYLKCPFLSFDAVSFYWRLIGSLPSCPEYDRHLAAAAGKTMATAYLDPNLNHAFLGGAKSRLSAGGSDRTIAGSVDRVLKVFHHFETNTEHSCWSSNIRYGDATDVRVRRDTHHHHVLNVFKGTNEPRSPKQG